MLVRCSALAAGTNFRSNSRRNSTDAIVMSAVRVRVLSAAEYFETKALSRSLSVFLLVSVVLFIFFAATFPFDFSANGHNPLSILASRWDWNPTPYDEGYNDRITNVLFFMPFGFMLASVVQPRPRRIVWQLMLALGLGLCLTCLIETLQAFVSFRDPSFADVWSNTLGSVLGAGIYAYIGDPILHFAAKCLLRLKPLVRPAVLAGLLVIYSAAQLAAPMVLRNPGDLSSWDTDMPMVIGYATGGDRPWNGNVYQIAIADQAATAEQAYKLAKGAEPAALFGDALLGNYRLLGKGPFEDTSHYLPPLSWTKESNDIAPGDPVSVDRDHTLTTPTPIKPATDRIARSSAFTIATTLSTAGQDQRGPAIILAISGPDRPFNVQIGQEFSDLSLRLRTTVRGAPEMYLPDVLPDNRPHNLIITQQQAQTVIYVDGYERGRVEVTPEAKVIWRLYPRGYFRLWIDRYGYRSYAAIYRVLVFIPFAALLAATLFLSRLREKTAILVGVAMTVVMAVALEMILGRLTASGFEFRNLLISLAAGLIALGILLWAHFRSKRRKELRFA